MALNPSYVPCPNGSGLQTTSTQCTSFLSTAPMGPGFWSVFAVCSKGSQGPKLSSCGHRRLWWDWADAQADPSLRWASIKRIGSKAIKKRWRHHFPHYKSMGAFCCLGNQSFDPICLKTLCSLSPPPVMLYIKFYQDWPTGLRDFHVWKCKIFVIQGQVTPKWVVWSGPKSNSSELLCLSWLPATFTIKTERASMETPFSHCKSMGNF